MKNCALHVDQTGTLAITSWTSLPWKSLPGPARHGAYPSTLKADRNALAAADAKRCQAAFGIAGNGELEKTRNEVEATGRKAYVYTMDVSKKEEVEATVATLLADAGRIDVLVNSAGILKPSLLQDLNEASWDAHFDVNANDVLFMCQAVLPHMRARKSGPVVNITHIAGRQGVPLQGHYAATKATVTNADQSAGAGGRCGRRYRQCDLPGDHPDRDGQEQPWKRRGRSPLAGGGSAETPRRSRRHRRAGMLLCVGTIGLRHRPGAQRLWRYLFPLNWLQPKAIHDLSAGRFIGKRPAIDSIEMG